MNIFGFLRQNYKENKRFWLLRLLMKLYWSPPLAAVIYYRIARFYYLQDKMWRARYFSNKNIKTYGCYISNRSVIGKNFKLKHANGVIIGEGVKIGDNVKIYQQVTLGGKEVGDLEKNNYPTVGNNVIIYAGAKIVGHISIGDNAVIGANSVVITDVEPNTVYGGIPAKRLK